MPVKRCIRHAWSGAILALSAAVVGAAVSPPEPAGSIGVLRPTVTAASGDTGGKFFGQTPDPQKVRHYFVAAEPEQWNYAPTGRDDVCGLPLPPPVLAERTNSKVRYVQYTDGTFGAKVMANPMLGLLGPVLRGVVGDYIVVTFLNRTSQPLSMHPHGVHYDKDSEGSYDRLGPGRGAAVGPGATFTYVWQLDEASGPLPSEPSSKAWLYHSHVRGDEETNLGLVGFIIVTDPARARPDGTPADIDREFGTLFMVFDESGLGEDAKEAAEYAGLPGAASAPKTWTQVQELLMQGSRYAINGRIFGNLPGLAMNEGERVRWYLFGLGDEHDFHTAHWHGLRVMESGRRTDVVELLPATMKVADFVADNPGSWLFHCHVAEHMKEGMFARFVVHPRDVVGADRSPGKAFLGLPEAAQSLRMTRVEAVVDPAPAAETPCMLTLEGAVTTFEAFSVFNQTLQLQLGQRAVTFRPDTNGQATAPGASLRITNAGSVGVVYGGVLNFEIKLWGADWLEAIRSLGLTATVTELSIPLVMKVGSAHHHAQARLVVRQRY